MTWTANTLTKALALAGRGVPVFPCASTKRPTCPHGFKDATTDAAGVRDLWRDYPGPLIGVPTGPASDIFVLDVDSIKHPVAEEWLERHAAYLPDTRQHRTQSGGLHLLFKHRDGLRNSESKLYRGVDTRGEGGYIIWWPAAVAQSTDHALPLADVPEWIVEALAPRETQPRPAPIGRNACESNGLELARLEGVLATVASAQEGERNRFCFWAACIIRDMVAEGGLDHSDGAQALTALLITGRHIGLPEREITRTIASATARAR
jgi:hypothetical protein